MELFPEVSRNYLKQIRIRSDERKPMVLLAWWWGLRILPGRMSSNDGFICANDGLSGADAPTLGSLTIGEHL